MARVTYLSSFVLSALALIGNLNIHSAHAEGGFVGAQTGIVDSANLDSFNNIPLKIIFGPQILDQFALEFGLMDMGEASYKDPSVVRGTNEVGFVGAKHGETIVRPNESTFVGNSKIHVRSFLVTFRFNLPVSDNTDLFFKTGANLWAGDYENIEIVANSDPAKATTRTVTKRAKTSAVDQITGAGVMWRPINSVAVRAELETTALDSAAFNRARFQLITLGAQFEF